MQDGISNSEELDEMASFIIDEAYPFDVDPISCVLSGSRGYGLNAETSDYDFIGIHIMDTNDCLEHPSHRRNREVISRKYTKDFQLIPPDLKGGYVSLQSFEMWKFISLLQSGSFQIYELLYMPEVHHVELGRLFELSRACLTNKIGMAAIGICRKDLPNNPMDRKVVIMCYYRLIQAIHYLLEESFEWRADGLFDYMGLHIPYGLAMLSTYKDPAIRTTPIEYTSQVNDEIVWLINEAERAMVASRLPEKAPQETLSDLLRVLKQIRLSMI